MTEILQKISRKDTVSFLTKHPVNLIYIRNMNERSNLSRWSFARPRPLHFGLSGCSALMSIPCRPLILHLNLHSKPPTRSVVGCGGQRPHTLSEATMSLSFMNRPLPFASHRECRWWLTLTALREPTPTLLGSLDDMWKEKGPEAD